MGLAHDKGGRRRGGMAGGFLLAFAILAGVVIGTGYGQPSIGFLVGLAVGSVLMVAVWLVDRRAPPRR